METREQLRERLLQIGASNFAAQYQQAPFIPEFDDETRFIMYSSLREGVRWTPDQGRPTVWLGRISESQILLHEVFGEGEHPCPPDMRHPMTMEEWLDYAAMIQSERNLPPP